MDAIQVDTTSMPPVPQPGGGPELDEAAVRAAVMAAEKEGRDPATLVISDVAQGNDAPTKEVEPQQAPVEVPEKFKTPTGEVDVEKLNAATKQLDEAIQVKEQNLEKVIEDAVAAYREKESKFKNLPNPTRVAETLQRHAVTSPAADEPAMTDDELRQRIAQEMQRDFLGATTELVDAIVSRRLKESISPVVQEIETTKQERQETKVRESMKNLAKDDPRVIQHFDALRSKLTNEPEFWRLKNPYKAAWLELREELRLGAPSPVQAQPSRPSSPILGGGTPPPTPLAQSPVVNTQNFARAINEVDPRNKAEMEALEKAARQLFR